MSGPVIQGRFTPRDIGAKQGVAKVTGRKATVTFVLRGGSAVADLIIRDPQRRPALAKSTKRPGWGALSGNNYVNNFRDRTLEEPGGVDPKGASRDLRWRAGLPRGLAGSSTNPTRTLVEDGFQIDAPQYVFRARLIAHRIQKRERLAVLIPGFS